MIEVGTRVVFDDPYDGPSAGVVESFDSFWKSLAYIKWDDGKVDSGIFVDELRQEAA